MNRDELEREALESVPAHVYYDLLDQIGETPDEILHQIIAGAWDFDDEGDE